MLTLKLYSEHRHRIVEAVSFTLFWYSASSVQITAHQQDGSEDKAFYVGDSADCWVVDYETWYDRAIVENSSGKTTEFIQPPRKPPAADTVRTMPIDPAA